MKVYAITIKPISGIGTPLKGDTIFGHFCWQIAYDDNLLGKTLDELLLNYSTSPFAVFSSACIGIQNSEKYQYAFKTPDLPMDKLFNLPEGKKQKIADRKEYKAKKWMLIREEKIFSSFKGLEFLSDGELLKRGKAGIPFHQPRNTINRLMGKTGEDRFAPFNVAQHVFSPGSELALFCGINETMTSIEQIKIGLQRIGTFGYGKDATSGLGKFEVGEAREVDLSKMGSNSPNACYTLAPCVPEKNCFQEMYFTPFTRFGRHGDVLAKSGNPFKNPVIMADEGGIFKVKNQQVFNKPYIGAGVTNLSKVSPKAVMQGYALYLPVEVED